MLAKVKFESHDRVVWASINTELCGGKLEAFNANKATELRRSRRSYPLEYIARKIRILTLSPLEEEPD